MLTQPISAANKLRKQVLSVPGTVLISQAGHPDKVIRLQHVPDYLQEFKVKNEAYIAINLGRGPHEEAWNAAMREFFSTARRDRPVEMPIPVAADSHEEWSVSPDEVPLIENGVTVAQSLNPTQVMNTIEKTLDRKPDVVEEPKQGIFKCGTCALTWDSNRALKTHERFAHKK